MSWVGEVQRERRHDRVDARARLKILELLIDHSWVLAREIGRIGAADARRAMTDRALLGERRAASDRISVRAA
jgi:hypothetical protein